MDEKVFVWSKVVFCINVIVVAYFLLSSDIVIGLYADAMQKTIEFLSFSNVLVGKVVALNVLSVFTLAVFAVIVYLLIPLSVAVVEIFLCLVELVKTRKEKEVEGE